MNVLCVCGTRPEAIKMAPLIKELQRRSASTGLRPVTCVTAQHRQMLDQVLTLFGIRPEVDLDLMIDNQSLSGLTVRALSGLTEVFKRQRPDLVLVQGDTTTAMAGSLAAFYEKIPLGHIEAGLRTGDINNPFPEEVNRRIISTLAQYHFAPTIDAMNNLLWEGIAKHKVFLTGNTIIDALNYIIARDPSSATVQLLKQLGMDFTIQGRHGIRCRTILVTAHRRENFGKSLENICRALVEIVERNSDVQIVYPVHLNPNVREPVNGILQGRERIHLIAPLSYEPFAQLLKRVYFVITDSGGIQEECPALGKPVLVIRSGTERAEAVKAGCAKIVGTDTKNIVAEAEGLLRDDAEYNRMACCGSPYGDGHAAERIVDLLAGLLGNRLLNCSLHTATKSVAQKE